MRRGRFKHCTFNSRLRLLVQERNAARVQVHDEQWAVVLHGRFGLTREAHAVENVFCGAVARDSWKEKHRANLPLQRERGGLLRALPQVREDVLTSGRKGRGCDERGERVNRVPRRGTPARVKQTFGLFGVALRVCLLSLPRALREAVCSVDCSAALVKRAATRGRNTVREGMPTRALEHRDGRDDRRRSHVRRVHWRVSHLRLPSSHRSLLRTHA